MKKKIALIFILLTLASATNLVYFSQIPVDKLTLFKSLLSMNMLKSQLDSTFGTPYQNKISMYIRTALTQGYLTQMNKQLTQYNNVVIGQNNTVSGNTNIVAGDSTKITGSNNWVFTQGFNGQVNSGLVMDNWLVHMDKKEQIKIDPPLAIQKW